MNLWKAVIIAVLIIAIGVGLAVAVACLPAGWKWLVGVALFIYVVFKIKDDINQSNES